MKNFIILKIIAVLLFFFLLAVGFNLAQFTSLWNDEIYTQSYNIENLSYQDIVSLKIKEGNVCPLFYLIQKGITDIFHYRLPFEWKNEWFVRELKGQTILRINPVVFISLSIVLMFYYLSKRSSLFMGLFAVGLCLSSEMFWQYWVDARPYALWIFLSTAQCLLFVDLIDRKERKFKVYVFLIIVNILLSLTVVFSIFQVFTVSLLLWVFRFEDFKSLKQKLSAFCFIFCIPAFISLTCYFFAPKYNFILPSQALKLITKNVPYEQIIAIFIMGMGSLGLWLKNDFNEVKDMSGKNLVIFIFTLLLFIFGLIIIAMFKFLFGKENAFTIDPRYFIFLVPVNIISLTVLFSYFLRILKEKKWLRFNVILCLCWVLFAAFVKHGFPIMRFF